MKVPGNPNFRPRLTLCVALALLTPMLGGCNIRAVLGWDMYDQAKVGKPYKASDFFEDRMSARPLVPGTVARSETIVDRASHGVDLEAIQYAGDGYPAGTLGEGESIDPAKLKDVLNRGQTVYNINCAVCHGQTGRGDGMIVQRGFIKPPSFVIPGNPAEREAMQKGNPQLWHRTELLQTAPPRHVYDAITRGFGGMYSYAERVKPKDRWAVAAYIKALQANPSPENFTAPKPPATR